MGDFTPQSNVYAPRLVVAENFFVGKKEFITYTQNKNELFGVGDNL